jgi:hypothetical protein
MSTRDEHEQSALTRTMPIHEAQRRAPGARFLRLSALLVPLGLTACTGSHGDVTGACVYPEGVTTAPDASTSGCFAEPSARVCQISNGATVLPDGGVANGTETCQSTCGAGEFALSCSSAGLTGPIPAPNAALGCSVVPDPTPPGELLYCCPCAH